MMVELYLDIQTTFIHPTHEGIQTFTAADTRHCSYLTLMWFISFAYVWQGIDATENKG